MRGAGTVQDITTADPPPARLLDVTRLASRAGRVLTGIDRVELAYLDELVFYGDTPVFGLARCFWGYAILDRAGLDALHRRVTGAEPWGPAHALTGLARRLDEGQRRAQSDLFRLAAYRSSRRGLGGVLRRVLPEGTAYLNCGHSNLTDRVVQAVRRVPGARVTVMIHDTIPLDYPDWQREGSVDRFRDLLGRAGREADLILANSHATAADIARYLPDGPPVLPAPLGVTTAEPARLPAALRGVLRDDRPFFLAVGTIEPRKNHALLLDVWDALSHEVEPEDLPALLICGTRGWRNEEVFARLDGSPLRGRHVFEVPGLSDGQIAALNDRAVAHLMPSLAEGFGLPPAEAAARGTPVLCHDLPVLREILGDFPVYLPANDIYAWKKCIKGMAENHAIGAPGGRTGNVFKAPGWDDHFKVVLKAT